MADKSASNMVIDVVIDDKRTSTSKVEVRSFTVENLQTEERGDHKPTLVGYAALFGVETTIGGMFRESIRSGAFTRAIQEKHDVRATLNHDPNYVFGRTKSGTLTIEQDDQGLRVEIDPPEAQWSKDIIASVKRGDIDQMSFQFIPKKVEWSQAEDQGGLDLREIVDLDLRDVSLVTFPAYDKTSVSARSADDVYEEYLQSRTDHEADTEAEPECHEASALVRRIELLQLDE